MTVESLSPKCCHQVSLNHCVLGEYFVKPFILGATYGYSFDMLIRILESNIDKSSVF